MPENIRDAFDSKKKFETHFLELVDYRNIVQHGGTLTDYQEDAAAFFMTEFAKLTSESS